MNTVYIIERKGGPTVDWTPVIAFPGMKCLHEFKAAARAAAEVMQEYDTKNAPGEEPVVRYRAVKYGPCK